MPKKAGNKMKVKKKEEPKCSKCGASLVPDKLGKDWFADQYDFPRLCLNCYLPYLEDEHGAAYIE